jgi:hypothetical protein
MWLMPLAGLSNALAVFAYVHFGHGYDFGMFYQDGMAWNTGAPLYQYPNLNPPLLTVTVFGPLARLPFDLAQGAWLVASLCSVIASFRLIGGELRFKGADMLDTVVLFLVCHGTFLQLWQGQIIWLLLYPVTRAWISFRQSRYVAAGLWLGPAIAVKPSLLLTAIVLAPSVWIVAGMASAALTGLGVLWTGWSPWSAWLETGVSVDWVSQHLNASLWGLATRLELGVARGSGLEHLSTATTVAVLAIGGWCAWRVVQTRGADQRFAGALLWHVLASPLGWITYLPLAVGPAAASWPGSRLAATAFALVCLPLGFASTQVDWPTALVRTAGLIYPVAVLCGWYAFSQAPTPMRAKIPNP